MQHCLSHRFCPVIVAYRATPTKQASNKLYMQCAMGLATSQARPQRRTGAGPNVRELAIVADGDRTAENCSREAGGGKQGRGQLRVQKVQQKVGASEAD